ALVFSVVIYRYYYDSRWIVGKTEKQIEFRYGKFDADLNYSPSKEFYPKYDPAWVYCRGYLLSNPDSNKRYYAVYFDKDGIALFVDEDWLSL
ncbi:MAG: hypothetical protein J6L92_08795, partial [Clostridia bacterium]|nr:hypothetical protein [Clostridia bacterium]